jgi:hypothetical protein
MHPDTHKSLLVLSYLPFLGVDKLLASRSFSFVTFNAFYVSHNLIILNICVNNLKL